jgi:hypothetical protein
MLFFDKSNKRSIKLETVVTWSKSNLNMMNIYEESTINFWICTTDRGNYLSEAVTPLISLSRWVFVYSEQVRTLWTRCKLVILNVFIGQFWIIYCNHFPINYWPQYSRKVASVCFIKEYMSFQSSSCTSVAPFWTSADTLNSVQASYFERFHWPILNIWTLQTVEHDGNGTRNSMLRGL